MEVSLYVTDEEDVCSMVTENGSNATVYEEKPEALYITYNVLLAVITVVIMFSMGSGIRVSDLLVIVKRPVGPVIGIVCQCFLMPAACFGYALLLQLAPNLAIGMVLVGCCPGGSISNIICFWTKADVCLSICMTTASTTLAILFLPLNMFIYSRYWVEDVSTLPYVNMVITVLYVWAAVLVGFLFGKKWPKSVPYLTKAGSVAALTLILVAGIIQGQLYPELFNLPWTAWFGAITMPIIGCVMGFVLALILCQKHRQRMAIGLETGIQNTALALTVIAITYPSSYQASCYSQFVLLYTTFQVVLGIATILLVWVYFFARHRITPCNMKHSYDDEGRELSEPGDLLAVTTVKGDAYAELDNAYAELDNVYTELDKADSDVQKHDLDTISNGSDKKNTDANNNPDSDNVYTVTGDANSDLEKRDSVSSNVTRRSVSVNRSNSKSSTSSVTPPPEYNEDDVTRHM